MENAILPSPFWRHSFLLLDAKSFSVAFFIKKITIQKKVWKTWVNEIEYQRRVKKYGIKAKRILDETSSIIETEEITLNQSIGILLRTYSQALNKERKTSGSIFRLHCKAKDGWIDEFVTVKKRNGKIDTRFSPGTDFAFQCFSYLHNNPKKAGYVKNEIDWIYSSTRDYVGLRNGTLCNLELGKSIIENF